VGERLEEVTQDVRVFWEFGKMVSGEDYVKAHRQRASIIEEMRNVFRRYDALINPTTPSVAPSIVSKSSQNEQEEGPREFLTEFTTPFNQEGQLFPFRVDSTPPAFR
jgi:aspartyl-tRNA(Asn)/glutamyl-tRNA(Gln) amidotransferase subunit A